MLYSVSRISKYYLSHSFVILAYMVPCFCASLILHPESCTPCAFRLASYALLLTAMSCQVRAEIVELFMMILENGM